MRTLAAILAIALEVALILLIVGLTGGIIADSAKRMEGVGAEIILRPPGSSFLLATSTAAMPVKIGEVLYAIEGVQDVTPVLTQFNTQGGLDVIYGIDLETFSKVSQGFVFLSGSAFREAQDVIVDDIYAGSKKLKVGDHVTFLNHRFRVCGIVEHGKGSRIFVPIQTVQELIGAPGKASLMFVRCRSKEDIALVTAQIRERLKGYSVLPMSEFVSQMSSANNNLPALRYFIRIVTLTAILVGFFVIFLAMYTAITERTREIGILKSLGASRYYVLKVFMKEALILCLLGFAAGVGISLAGQFLISKVLPQVQVQFTPEWFLRAGLIALLSSVLGALYPSMRAASQDPIDALSYE